MSAELPFEEPIRRVRAGDQGAAAGRPDLTDRLLTTMARTRLAPPLRRRLSRPLDRVSRELGLDGSDE